MSLPLVSIIMPAYNVGPYISEAIQSVQQQTYTNWELLIADDCSTDNTREMIASFSDPKIRCFHNETNIKVLHTRNKLIQAAKGQFIALLDADDVISPEKIEKQLAAFSANPKLGACGTWVQIIGVDGSKIAIHKKPLSNAAIQNALTHSNPMGEATLMIRAEVFEKVGLFRTYFHGLPCQSYDLIALIGEHYELENISEVLYFYRMNPNSNSKIINPKRIVAYNLVQHLAKQRKEHGVDDLMKGRVDLVDQKMTELLKPYKDDPSLVFRHYAASFMYSRLYRKAIKASRNAVAVAPGKLINYRTLAYCIRKTLAEAL